MASRNDLVRKILKILGSWQAGQELSPEDYRAVDEELPTRLLAMSEADIYQASVGNIPDEAVDAIAAYLAVGYIPQFGLAGEEADRVRQACFGDGVNDRGAIGALKYLNTMRPTYSVIPGQFF
jgi:hypothetical protein